MNEPIVWPKICLVGRSSSPCTIFFAKDLELVSWNSVAHTVALTDPTRTSTLRSVTWCDSVLKAS